MPAQQLFDRLGAVFSDEPWVSIQAAGGWPANVGAAIADLKAMVIHETTGWPPRVNGRNMFRRAFLGAGGGLTTQLYVAGDGTVLQGMELPRRTGHAGFVNDARSAARPAIRGATMSATTTSARTRPATTRWCPTRPIRGS